MAIRDHQGSGHDVNVRPAIFGRNAQAVEAHFLGLRDQFGELIGGQGVFIRIEAVLQGHDFFADKTPDHVDDQLLFLGE